MNPNDPNNQPQPPVEPTPAPAPQVLNSPQPEYQNQSMSEVSDQQNPISTKSKKPLFMVLGALGLIVIGVSAFLLIRTFIGNGNKTYSVNDLVTYSNSSYTISYPKQWKDQSGNQKLKDAIIGSELKGPSIFASKVNSTNDFFDTGLFVGFISSGISDTTLKAQLADTTVKQKFIDTVKASISQNITNGGSICQSYSNLSTDFAVNGTVYPLEFNINSDCTYNGKKLHLLQYSGFKNGNIYILVITTTSADWSKNSDFYKNKIVSSLKPV